MKHHNVLPQSSDSRKDCLAAAVRRVPQRGAIVFPIPRSSGKGRLTGNKEEKIGQGSNLGNFVGVPAM